MWTVRKFQFVTLFVTCYEEYLTWEEGILDRRDLKLYYRDIISVSGADGAKHLGGTSRIDINTAGQTYSFSSTLGSFRGIQECLDIINERIQFFRNKDREDAKSLELEKEKSIAEAVAKAVQEQSSNFINSFQNVGININPDNIEPTITRIELFLEDKDWDKAKAYAEAALDYFPTDYRLYLALLCIDEKVSVSRELENCTTSLEDNPNYRKALKFADGETTVFLKEINDRAKNNSVLESRYSRALKAMDNLKYDLAASLFRCISGYKDSDTWLDYCEKEISEAKIREAKELESKRILISALNSPISSPPMLRQI